MNTHTITTYAFAELSDDAKEKALEESRECVETSYLWQEIRDSLQGLLDLFDANERGKPFHMSDYAEELEELRKTSEDCPFTGVCFDAELAEYLFSQLGEYSLSDALYFTTQEAHHIYEREVEHATSDESLANDFEAMDAEFFEDGTFYNE